MKLLEYIKNNNDWKEKLSKEPYYLKIKQSELYPNLYIFNYNLIKSDFAFEICKEARGVIIDVKDEKVVCRGFDKFFNYGESYSSLNNIDWNSAKVQEKIDGSLLKLYYYNAAGEWLIATSSNILAKDSPVKNTGYTFETLFLSAIKKYKCNTIKEFVNKFHLSEKYTYCFEIVSLYNQIVVKYNDIEIYLLCIRETETGKEININNNFGLKVPKEYPLHSLQDCLNVLKTFNKNDLIENEGFVVVDKNFNRIKIKSEEYVAMHYSVSGGFPNYKLLRIVRENEVDELLNYFPKYKQVIIELKNDYNNYIKYLQNKIKAAAAFGKIETREDRKRFALEWKNDNCKEIFKLLDLDFNLEKFLNSLSDKELFKKIKYYKEES